MTARKSTELLVFGSGIGFPFRLNTSTGGVVTTSGNTDATSVALEYLQDSWSIRETVTPNVNHIAESIAHILLTRPGEHDTLPEFGSQLFVILFEQNTYEFRKLAEIYFKFSTIRWEKRAQVPDIFSTDIKPGGYSGVRWNTSGIQVDRGVVPVWVTIDFITGQMPGNLVIPFVTDRDARYQEYRSGNIDSNGHDHVSRYRGYPRSFRDNHDYIRLQKYEPIPVSSNDSFYSVKRGDTWLLLAYKFYGDIRWWYTLARCYISDSADAGLGRSNMKTLADPPIGTMLRVPPKATILMSGGL
jgi:phage baseplate assembly protein W